MQLTVGGGLMNALCTVVIYGFKMMNWEVFFDKDIVIKCIVM